jgi:hypothetical protein
MRKAFGTFVILISVAGFAFGSPVAPEIDGGSAVSALGLLSGALLLVRTRAKK